jgi:hypothetical protein
MREEGLNPEQLLEHVTEAGEAKSVLGKFAELVQE